MTSPDPALSVPPPLNDVGWAALSPPFLTVCPAPSTSSRVTSFLSIFPLPPPSAGSPCLNHSQKPDLSSPARVITMSVQFIVTATEADCDFDWPLMNGTTAGVSDPLGREHDLN